MLESLWLFLWWFLLETFRCTIFGSCIFILYIYIWIYIYIKWWLIRSFFAILCTHMYIMYVKQYAHIVYVYIYIHTRTIYIVLWVMVPKMALHSTLSSGAAPQPSRRSDVWRLFVGHLCCWPLGSWQTSCRRGMSRVASRHQVQLRHPEGTESGDPWKKTPFLDSEKQVNFDRRWYVSLVEDWQTHLKTHPQSSEFCVLWCLCFGRMPMWIWSSWMMWVPGWSYNKD